MTNNDVMGLVFANVHDDLIRELTAVRSMASIPFGGRYRLIDFSLSNLVNAGISKVGVIPQFNYHSLMDHLGSGKPWDLDRKSGGLFILPPYVKSALTVNTGHIQSINDVMSYLTHSNQKYVVMCDADVIGNLNIADMLNEHYNKGADISIAYKNGVLPKSHSDIMSFDMNDDKRINKIRMSTNNGVTCSFSLDVVIIERVLLISLIKTAMEENAAHLWRDVFQPNVDRLKIYGYEVKETAFVIDGTESYAKANFALLDPEVRKELFNSERPIYTKIRDDVPTKYGLNSEVTGSLIANGCVIDGTVKNSIVFRGVKVEAGAVLENCIIMQDCVIHKDANLKYVIADKNGDISEGRELCGAPTHFMFINKSAKV